MKVLKRIDYINRYLIELDKIAKEIPVKGYFPFCKRYQKAAPHPRACSLFLYIRYNTKKLTFPAFPTLAVDYQQVTLKFPTLKPTLKPAPKDILRESGTFTS